MNPGRLKTVFFSVSNKEWDIYKCFIFYFGFSVYFPFFHQVNSSTKDWPENAHIAPRTGSKRNDVISTGSTVLKYLLCEIFTR